MSNSKDKRRTGARQPKLTRVLGEQDRVSGDLPESDDLLLSLHRTMILVRVLDRRMLNLQRQGRIGFYGSSVGQEAAIVGSGAALEPRDWILPALREGGAALYRGFPLDRYIAQCFGNAFDLHKGRQMPSHYGHRDTHFVSMSSVIGTQIPQAAGVAMAAKIRGDDTVVMGYMGDGATSSHEFSCGLNFAAVYKAPVVFVCQNNQFAISIPFEKQTASDSIAVKGEAFGMHSERVDGNDALAVYRVCRKAVKRARSGKGPTLVEAVTFRMGPHSSSDDPSRYRPGSLEEEWGRKDPIDRFTRFLESRNLWSDQKRKDLESELEAEISTTIHEVESAAAVPVSSLFEDVFAEIPPHLSQQADALDGATGETVT